MLCINLGYHNRYPIIFEINLTVSTCPYRKVIIMTMTGRERQLIYYGGTKNGKICKRRY